jgi:hypothetical protein
MVFFCSDTYFEMDEFDNSLSNNEKGSFRGCENNIILFTWLWLQVLAHWRYSNQMSWGLVLNNWLIQMWVFETCLAQWKQFQVCFEKNFILLKFDRVQARYFVHTCYLVFYLKAQKK